jgi:hypothetical protein
LKRLSNNSIDKAIEEFPPNSIGRQQADAAKSIEAAQRSTTARIAAAVAEYNATPRWAAPRLNISEARATAHERLRKQNEERQRNQ